MNLIKNVLFSALLLFSISTYAGFARVIKVKGKVSQLPPGALKATWIKKGQLLKQDTSVVTRTRSFVKIEILEDGSYVTLGPNSKLEVTKIQKKEGSIIQLLNGKMRAKVVPRKDDLKNAKNKVYIKTKTMALGVRGTEFVTVVSQENQATSVVTLKGTVAVKKINNESVDVEDTVKQNLEGDDVTLVKKGNVSTTYAHLHEEVQPQRVNPVQLVALKKNENLETVARSKAKPAKNVKLTQKDLDSLYAKEEGEQKVNVEEVPRNGAIVDLNSGIFIPEIKDKSVKVGAVDKNTGQYIAANGIKLDKKKGFVPTNKNNDESVELAKKLNQNVKYKQVKASEVVDHGGDSLTQVSNHHSIKTGISLKNNEYSPMGNSGNDDSNDFFAIGINFDYIYTRALTNRVHADFIAGIKLTGTDKSQAEPEDGNDEDDFIAPNLGVKLHYRFDQRFSINTGFILTDDIFYQGRLDSSLNTVVDQTNKFAPYMTFGIEYQYSDKWAYLINYNSHFSIDSHSGIFSGKGFELGAKRRVGNEKWISLAIDKREYLGKDLVIKNFDFHCNYEMEF